MILLPHLLEGLIASASSDKVTHVIKTIVPSAVPETKDWQGTQESLLFTIDLTKTTSEQFQKMSRALNVLGWFVGGGWGEQGSAWTKDHKFDEVKARYNTWTFTVEPKYDINVTKRLGRYLYHITKTNVVAKIRKTGLVPRAGSKVSNHPERIYLASDMDAAGEIESGLSQYNGAQRLLVIDREKIPNHQFYLDRNFLLNMNTGSFGVYTLNPIPPNAISFGTDSK